MVDGDNEYDCNGDEMGMRRFWKKIEVDSFKERIDEEKEIK